MFRRLLVLSALVIASTTNAAGVTTYAERSGFKRTGRFEEVQRLCAAFAKEWPKSVRCVEFGRSAEGRPLLALVASADGLLDPAANRDRKRPVALMQAGIHAGEIDGKDAGFWALRELLTDKKRERVLRQVTFVFVPVLNVDGHERFGRWNRPNQNGPEESGWRTTAQNFNLNRDYVKADAPETRSIIRLLNEWDPILYSDLHATNGAEFEHDISLNVAPTQAGDEQLRGLGVSFRDALMARTRKHGSLPVDFYPAFNRDDDPMSGVNANVGPPRFSHQYWALRNRLAVLVETHSWKDYPTRVRITRNVIHDMLELLGEVSAQWQTAIATADQRARALGGTTVALDFVNTDATKTIEFRGYEYTRTPSAISGALLTRYNNKRPQIWRMPLRDEVRPSATVVAPRGGYVIPVAQASVIEPLLALHGIEYRRLTSSLQSTVEVFRADAVKLAHATFEGRTPVTLQGAWKPEPRAVAPGSLFIPIGQRNAALAVHLFEPGAPDSLVNWGFFNAAFERKEYMEAYVAETVAEEMLKKDPALRAEFERKLTDREFAASPEARLEFFYRRHPSWDERLNLYPIYRTDDVLVQ